MDLQQILETVTDLTDLELAVLLSLIAQQHCLISTDDDLIDELSSELALIASEWFDLSCAVIGPEDQQSVQTFGAAILNQNLTTNLPFEDTSASTGGETYGSRSRSRSVNIQASSSRTARSDLDQRMVVNVIIAKEFNSAHRDVQIAALELIQRRRIFSHTTVHPVPKVFLFIPVIKTSTKTVRLNHHLNDRIFISHCHEAVDGFVNLEELESRSFEREGMGSGFDQSTHHHGPRIAGQMIQDLRRLGDAVSMTAEIRRYIQDLIVHLRMERGVDGGVTPFATTMVVALAKYLAAIHGSEYVTPSLVGLAMRKVYPHRIVIAGPARERSMQWGSDIERVQKVLEGINPENVIEHVLLNVQCPV